MAESIQAGRCHQVASTTATRQTTKDFVGIAQPHPSKAIDKDKKLKALLVMSLTNETLLKSTERIHLEAGGLERMSP